MSDDEVLDRALNDVRIKTLLGGKTVMKTVVVPKKLVNIVVREQS